MNKPIDPSIDLLLMPRDPLIFRDGRPFGFGSRMKSLPWVTPSVLAGSLRSLLGKADGRPFEDQRGDLKKIHSTAAFPVLNDQMYLPAPLDLMLYREGGALVVQAIQPASVLAGGEGVLGPDAAPGLQVLVPPSEQKPYQPAAWWRVDRLARWLAGERLVPRETTDLDHGYWAGPQEDLRNHVGIDPDQQVATEGMLFQTAGRDLNLCEAKHTGAVPLAMRVTEADGCYTSAVQKLDATHPLGGERRLVHWKACMSALSGWNCPDQLRDALGKAQPGALLRLYLASPAHFGASGWLPDWLDADLQGEPPGCGGLTVQLVAARIERWHALSGWDYEKPGPKAVRRLVPAGSVYFFTLVDGNAALLADRWLQPVQKDTDTTPLGFGMGAWGIGFKESKQ
ncbi:MAG: type III-B CRISPR module-associated Cmr3 family protein [Rhodoferax sp.]|uniref:type III-B CRISPR module-associated Cmr3 family protein n=1 Tax=Rhodoferax sp. TaxID=50421 RepID=UPI002604CD7D|nr:type III-B CRISPR module-associated Cmr3 family protein [Rhodoferax sp.]MDD5333028.1 type III-B CRISPR module-associated Cmr3 family protein [Rhodoferax sp.]